MEKNTEKKKKIIIISSIAAIVIILISVITLLILKYNIEGETNMPFKITSIMIASTANGNIVQNEDSTTNVNVIQNNDFYFYIEKNENYKKDDSISKVTFTNFNLEKNIENANVNIYKPSVNSLLFEYSDNYKVENEITYKGTLNNNMPALEISNQGGLMCFSIALENIGAFAYNEADTITYDGTLLSTLGLTNEDIKTKVSFDIIIETTSNKKYKSTVSFDLPIGNIVEEGRAIYNKEDYSDVIFKRI